MSTVALLSSAPTSNVLIPNMSSTQDRISDSLLRGLRHFEAPATRQKLPEALNSVFEAFAQSRQNDDVTPVPEATYKEAVDFLRKLPTSLPFPEVIAERDGDLALEWYQSNYYSFVIGFAGNGTITYSGLFGSGRSAHGTEPVSEGIPASIIENIRRVYSSDHAR